MCPRQICQLWTKMLGATLVSSALCLSCSCPSWARGHVFSVQEIWNLAGSPWQSPTSHPRAFRIGILYLSTAQRTQSRRILLPTLSSSALALWSPSNTISSGGLPWSSLFCRCLLSPTLISGQSYHFWSFLNFYPLTLPLPPWTMITQE